MKKLLLIIAIFLIISSVSAFNVTPDEIGTSYIRWSWTESPITNLSVDGIMVCNLDPASTEFILSSLGDNTCHTINVYSAGDTGTNTACTETSSATQMIDWSGAWFMFIVAIICIAIGTFVPYIAFAGCAFAIIGIVTNIQESFITGFIFMVVFCAGVIVGFSRLRSE